MDASIANCDNQLSFIEIFFKGDGKNIVNGIDVFFFSFFLRYIRKSENDRRHCRTPGAVLIIFLIFFFNFLCVFWLALVLPFNCSVSFRISLSLPPFRCIQTENGYQRVSFWQSRQKKTQIITKSAFYFVRHPHRCRRRPLP